MPVSEAFPGAREWEKFDEACAKAEAERNRATEKAQMEQRILLHMATRGEFQARERVEAAANERYERKAKAAREACDKACEEARGALTKALDAIEKERS